MDDVDSEWYLFLVAEYIILWYEYYLNQIQMIMDEDE